jgi:hypothetical protein
MSSQFALTLQMRSIPTLRQVLKQGNFIPTKDVVASLATKEIEKASWPREISTLDQHDEFDQGFVPDPKALSGLMDACRRMERSTRSPEDAKDESDALVTVLLSDGTTRSFRVNEDKKPVACKNPSWVSFLKIIDYRYDFFSKKPKIFFENK